REKTISTRASLVAQGFGMILVPQRRSHERTRGPFANRLWFAQGARPSVRSLRVVRLAARVGHRVAYAVVFRLAVALVHLNRLGGLGVLDLLSLEATHDLS